VVVESPGKISKISHILGSDYTVKASMGHLLDLPQKGLGIDVKNNFEADYQVIPKKKETVADLKKAAKEVDEVYLASDNDREGSFISESIRRVLDRKGLTFHRVVFNAITKSEIEKAFASPSVIDTNMVESQMTRRLVDRLTGFKISPLLWRQTKSKEESSRSAGRVQSVGLQMIVDRQHEIDAFISVKYWTIEALVSDKIDQFTVELQTSDKLSISSQEKADKFVTYLQGQDFIVESIDKSQEQKKPYAPFTTSTLQQTASSILNWNPKKAMSVAQKLYESGFLSYVRTDSVILCDEAIKNLVVLVPKILSNQYLPSTPYIYQSKSKGAQEAHEAIRPTNLTDDLPQVLASVTGDEAKLLELVWRRTIASQMSAALFDKVEVIVKAGKAKLKVTGQIQKFDGFLKIWTHTDTKETKLPELKVAQQLDKIEIKSVEHETKPPARYNGASLIKELENNGVGRPSTYASIIDTLIDRGYVEMDKKAFVPTQKGFEVSDFLKKHFSNIINVGFTSQMEEDLDKIAAGDKTKLELLTVFYKELSGTIDAVKAQISTNELSEENCPACKSPMFVKLNRQQNQRFLACSNKECKKTFNLDEAGKPVENKVEKLDKQCPECKGDLIKKTGKFGTFYGCTGYKDGCKVTASEDGTIKIPPKTTGKKCKKCKKGNMLERTNKATGDKFFGCSRFQQGCKHVEKIE